MVEDKQALVKRVLQYFLAVLLATTALGKALDVGGFAAVLKTYQAFPAILLGPMALGIIVGEFALSGWLFSGKRLKEAGGASLLLHAGFAAVAAMTLLRGIDVPNCGCFGVFLARPLTWGTVGQDLFLVACSAGLFVAASRRDPSRTPRTP